MAKQDSFSVVCKNENKTGVVVISGYIDSWGENNASAVLNAIEQSSKDNDSVRIDIVNCYGGSVFEGLPVCRAISDNPKVSGTRLNGVGASMGAALFVSGKKREVVKSSRLMIHKPSSGAFGQAQELRSTADLLDSVEDDLAELFASATGKTKQVIAEKWMQPYKDSWLTSAEMIDEGFATEEITGKIKEDAPSNVLETKDIGMVAAYYHDQLQDNNPIIENTMSENKATSLLEQIKSLLTGKKEDEPVPVIENSVDELNAKIEELTAKATGFETVISEKDTQLNDVTAKLTDIEAKYKKLEETSAALVAEVEAKESDITEVKSLMALHKTALPISESNKTFYGSQPVKEKTAAVDGDDLKKRTEARLEEEKKKNLNK